MRPVVHVFRLYTVGGEGSVSWHFISPNGRRLARCVTPFGTAADVLAGISDMLAGVDGGSATVRPTATNRWRWALSIDGNPTVIGSGDHDRRVRCEHAWRRFVLAAPLAVVDPVIHTFRRVDAGRLPQSVR
jgi:hypothetical protein